MTFFRDIRSGGSSSSGSGGAGGACGAAGFGSAGITGNSTVSCFFRGFLFFFSVLGSRVVISSGSGTGVGAGSGASSIRAG